MRRSAAPALGLLLLLVAPQAGSSAAEPATSASTTDDIFKGETRDPYQLALRAYVWGYPLVRAAQLRQNTTLPPDPGSARPPSPLAAPINHMRHARELATPAMRQGVAPNNDTLYSLAWLDMNDGPFVLETPDFGARYYTFQMGQADSSTDVSLGQRTNGSHLAPVFIHGPGSHASVPTGMIEVRSSQRYLMIAGRILVEDADDLPTVHRLQDGIRLRRWLDHSRSQDVAPPVSPQRPLAWNADAGADPLQFLQMLGTVLRDWRVTPEDSALVRSFERIGLTAGDGFQADRLSPAVRRDIKRGLEQGEATVRRKTFTLGSRVNGWAINYKGSQFGRDHLLRAAVAMDQIYVLPAAEAIYPNARTDIAEKELDGRKSYVLRFEKGKWPPVESFWSVTMYFAKGLMVPNPIARYSIGDRTSGLMTDRDGSLEIVLQHDRPRDTRANWLPTPSEPFMLMMRLYRPKAAVLSGAWAPPGIVQVPAQ